jgi:8-oxo-dGTP pyrophosphatase MutT (NUDIX family)
MTERPLRATVSLRGVLFGPRDDVLVVRRTADGGWELPGGRLGAKEDAVDGVRREIEEETGLEVEVRRPVHAVSWRNDDDDGRFGVYFRCLAPRREVSLSREHVEYDWLSPRRAAKRLSDVQGKAVRRALEVHER